MAPIVQQWTDATTFTTGTTPNGAPISSKDTTDLSDLAARTALENNIHRPRSHTVSFHYNSAVEQHHFGRSHPMKPWRLHLTKQLVLSYGLQHAMDCYETRPARHDELAEFHTHDYLDFLHDITPDNTSVLPWSKRMHTFNFGEDCPVFDGLYDYCALYTGATLSATRTLLASTGSAPPGTRTSSRTTAPASDIAINWSGGLHHALKSQASGFCYINDIVLAIQLLLTRHPRVLYIDIDVHHGDGVEHAFASSDRVLTLSLHKYDPVEFFPGTGGPQHTGPENPHNPGYHHSLNVPLKDGIDDAQYTRLFDTVVSDAVSTFQPTAIVLQCGGDSLGGDRLGKFNLNIRAHGHCVSRTKRFGLPLLLLGGGGYTARNVARLWTHETALCTESSLSDTLPSHIPYRLAFEGPENGNGRLYPELDTGTNRHTNAHDTRYIEGEIARVREQLRYLRGAPSVAMRRLPRDVWALREEIEGAMREEEEDEEMEEAARAQNESKSGGGGGSGGAQSKAARARKNKEADVGGIGERV